MRQVLYVSNTARDMREDALLSILEASRRNNSKVGVSGILLYIDGGFMQVLEGEPNDVETTLSRIQLDKRHWNTVVLLDRHAPRSFSSWSMGFERPKFDHTPNGIFSITKSAIEGRLAHGGAIDIITLLQTFYRVQFGEVLT